MQGVALGTLFGLLAQVEVATGGWGAGSRIFGLGQLPPLGSAVGYALVFLLSAALGVVVAAVHTRWGMPALWALLLGSSVVGGVVAGVGVSAGWWTAAAALLAGVPGAVLLVGALLLLTGVLGLAGFAVLRRTTP